VLGYDHLLFLFGLLLVGRDFRSLVAIVTSFTAAHSLTLSLATLGLIAPAGWTIEAAIALSIAYVGVENLLATNLRHRWKLTFIFGLVHGFGFANILREMHLPRSGLLVSLFSFNLGVEVGQVAIVAAMWPALAALARSPRRQLVTRTASIVIVALGLYWFIERVS
jgi:hydrogenase/urease accessory protein HupE